MVLTKEQIQFLQNLGLNYDYSKINEFSDEWAEIEERVGDELMYEGLDDDYAPNEIGKMCYSILDIIP